MFRGLQTGRVDEKHRLCVSALVRKRLQEVYRSSDVFVTSLDGKEVRVYPISEWEQVEAKLKERSTAGDSRDGQVKGRILRIANHYGLEGSLDNQGRVLVPGPLREGSGIEGDVAVLWQANHLSVMNAEQYQRTLEESQLSSDDLAYAENLGL